MPGRRLAAFLFAPILVLSFYNPFIMPRESFYARLFAKAYDPVMERLEERLLLSRRQELLGNVAGKVLEVGSGTGVNFPLYAPEAQVLAVEPSAAMMGRARRKLEEVPVVADIELVQASLEAPELEQRIAPESLDYIVCTLVLCTVPDLTDALSRFQRWLRPGGRLLAMEHIHDSRQPQKWLQQKFTPLWKHMAEGCHLNRPTDRLLKEAGFRPVREDYLHTKWIPFYWAVLEK